MTVDPRAALDRFVAALEAHHHAIRSRRVEQDPAVDDAYDILADAFDVYAEAVGRAYNEALPFDITDDDDDGDDDDDATELYDVDKVPDEAFEDFDDEAVESDGADESDEPAVSDKD